MKIIKVTCRCDDTLPLEELTEFQGGLKFRSVSDVERIEASILEHGIAFPLFVWRENGQNHVIDGHGRLEALRGLAKQGYAIPPLPAVYVKAGGLDEAKSLLLRVNSLYGEIDRDALLSLIEEAGASADGLSFPGVDLCFADEAPGASIWEDGGIPYEPRLDPEIDTSGVSDKDIENAAKKLSEAKPGHELVEFKCRGCGSKIFVKRETVLRYLKGEYV